jgi:membrane protein implicated in regulation of membrane protease activity
MVLVGGIPIFLLVVELLDPEVHFLKKGAASPEVMPLKVFLLSFTAATLFLIWFVRRRMLWRKGRQPLENPVSRLFNCFLATNLLCETVAISGLSLFFLTRSLLCFHLYMLLSLVLFAYFFPRMDEWKEWMMRVEPVGRPVFWLHPNLLQMPELDQGRTPAPALFSGQPEGSHLRQAAQDGMHRLS